MKFALIGAAAVGCDRMQYRGLECTVVEGIKRGFWKWSASVAGIVKFPRSANEGIEQGTTAA
jgi:hypothetical protein